ncbi:helix-turn-helix transcriptional regulator [Colwellia psychrerythraea]|uniref:Transcriptional regulator, XRE family n=1 Tax=Colwellia psychrerythraea TaxID=28229 RepID=A0A099L3G3_COLPS|nr:helix-turn-helix transcriptional regulator [Colwellia psychrerythraea]KGJ97406.1 transcriptional regulator, XRE family [Colwellia psychrerythraea]
MSKKAKGIISNQLRKKRFEKDEMTQQELAKALGITRQTIAAIEAGKYSPSLEIAFCLTDIFETSLDEIFQWQSYQENAEQTK